jgi:hypothetical protein
MARDPRRVRESGVRQVGLIGERVWVRRRLDAVEMVFSPFYFGAALGAILFDDKTAKQLALAAARSLASMHSSSFNNGRQLSFAIEAKLGACGWPLSMAVAAR